MGLELSLISFLPNTTIRSSDANSNNNAINGATTPDFQVIYTSAGTQESGYCGALNPNAVSGNICGQGVNFKTVLKSGPPSSVTLTADNSGAISSGPTGTRLHANGFLLSWTASGNPSFWYGQYTTVGNCLVEVDTGGGVGKGFFSHHCDRCNTLHEGRSLSEHLQVFRGLGERPGDVGLFTLCPVCGASESYKTDMSAADEQEDELLPPGAGLLVPRRPDFPSTRAQQAKLIRAAMRWHGLEVLP